MADDSDRSKGISTIGIECEALEGPTWGMGRQVRKLLEGLTQRDDLKGRFRFVLYSNNPLPVDPLYDHVLFTRRPCGLKAYLGPWAPSSFSIHYYVLLPLTVLWDSIRRGVKAMYYPNYMLPIIHPPHVRSLVMLTDDIFKEARNPALHIRYRLAYLVFALFWAKRRATKIMAISHASKTTLERKGIAPDRITVNEMGVPEPSVISAQAPPSDFLFIGQAFPRRRLKESLEAFARIAHERPGLTFRVIGKDKYPEPTIAPLTKRINDSLGRRAVMTDEFVPDEELVAAYRAASALVYVSDTEGFGMPPLEALSYGTPAVVADEPVNREIYGEHAFFVEPPLTGESIETVMRRALDDGAARERIISAGPGIIARYSWRAHTDRFMDIMNTLTA